MGQKNGEFSRNFTKAKKLKNENVRLVNLGCECISACGRIEAVNMESFFKEGKNSLIHEYLDVYKRPVQVRLLQLLNNQY